jgi:hypothetical protein
MHYLDLQVLVCQQHTLDALDANGNVYDFSSAYDLFRTPSSNPGYINSRTDRRKEVQKRLDGLLDHKYESRAEHEINGFGYKNWQVLPAATVGMGMQFHITKTVILGLEQRVIITGFDLLDGYRWQQDDYAGFTRDNDMVSYTSINLLFNVGSKKKTEPLFWLNPIHHAI